MTHKILCRPGLPSRAILAAVTGMLLFGGSAFADEFVYTFTGTWDRFDPQQGPYGTDYTITIVADNGGASNANQTYLSGDVVSVFVVSGTFMEGGPVVFAQGSAPYYTDAQGRFLMPSAPGPPGDLYSQWDLYFDGNLNFDRRLQLLWTAISWRSLNLAEAHGVAVDDVLSGHASAPGVPVAPLDSDGDGVADDVDACVNSDLSPTIVIDGIDTGVENQLFDDGCTMSDLIGFCVEISEDHGDFVSCVAHLTNDWKKEGVISGKEKGKIQSAAAKAFK